ncbi:hypothetical protein [Streptosporangium subroseum]|uniref:hypothetical protein n=1 Tax=Streptosporangium subroseum TaxID=106412 RepID=UPI00308D4FC4|nr:hypothetical protein OHB15_24085 [Streptosporangium subroseum]
MLAQAHLEEMSHAVEASLAEPRPLEEWLPQLTKTLVGLHAVNPRLHRVLFEEAPRPPELLARFHHAEGQAAAAVEALLRADPGPKVAEPARKARFVVATVESLIHRFIGRTPQADEQELAEEIVLIVTRYLR